ncbi:unnamed protein product [Polarella glacialis]|uniref:C3H1-type domain-containing protein n=2 Tax=Polarella glacialis TaxID=89957 RepID=A0A813KY52_POLGL|nr:unnamed protein product [Polarella glacialis]
MATGMFLVATQVTVDATSSKDAVSRTNDEHKPNQVYLRTSFCKFFAKGNCTRGFGCQFAHDKGQLRQKPVLAKTSICLDLVRAGRCRVGAGCKFAHSPDELRPQSGTLKNNHDSYIENPWHTIGGYCAPLHNDVIASPAEVDSASESTASSVGSGGTPCPDFEPTLADVGRGLFLKTDSNNSNSNNNNNLPDVGRGLFLKNVRQQVMEWTVEETLREIGMSVRNSVSVLLLMLVWLLLPLPLLL